MTAADVDVVVVTGAAVVVVVVRVDEVVAADVVEVVVLVDPTEVVRVVVEAEDWKIWMILPPPHIWDASPAHAVLHWEEETVWPVDGDDAVVMLFAQKHWEPAQQNEPTHPQWDTRSMMESARFSSMSNSPAGLNSPVLNSPGLNSPGQWSQSTLAPQIDHRIGSP